MQVTEVILARIILFAEVRLLNSSVLSLHPIHSVLFERYKFLIYPSAPIEFYFTKGVRYSEGKFLFDDREIGVALTIFTDGWVVETLVSTEASEAFWNDVADWVTTIGFISAKELVTSKVYESQVVAHSNLELGKRFGEIQPLVKLIAELSGNPTEQMSGFYIGGDGARLSTFTFERRTGVPFSENKYFSRAALPSSKHMRVLSEIEKILTH